MLFTAFKSLSQQLLVISGIVVACSLVVWAKDGKEAVISLLRTGVLQMKGPWIWTFGYGLAFFVMRQGPVLASAVDGVLIQSDVTAAVMARIERSTLHRKALYYTAPITLLGAILTAAYGIPNKGIAHVILFIASCSIYYVAAFLLFHFIEITAAFHELFESMASVEFRKIYSPLHLENLTSYLALTTTLGLIAIYSGFRGTLTAGFQFQHEIWRFFLSTPLLLFLPGTLFYNYYPRYVLRKILQHRVFRTMERLGAADQGDTKSLILDLKESAVLDSQILPFLDYKSLPSYLIAIFFALSLAYNNDPAVGSFLRYLFNLGSK